MTRSIVAVTMLLGGSVSCAHAVPAKLPSLKPGEAPPWVTPYSPAQQALLAPVDHPIQVPAHRVFPDLARFAYANNHVMATPEEGVKFTRMVATVLSDSPRFYALDDAKPELANDVVQYGPPGGREPDGWLIPRRAGDGDELAKAPVSEFALAAFQKGQRQEAARDLASAVEQYRIAIAKSPEVPAMRLALANALVSSGELAPAEASYRDIVKRDPSFAPAHVALAELAARRDDPTSARREIAEALAYAPASKRAGEVAVQLGAAASRFAQPKHPFPIFLDVDVVGAIHVGTSGGSPQQMYAGCRAILRYEPDVRSAIFDEPPDTPYYLSVVEEVVCIEAALGAYMIDRASGEASDDTDMDVLLRIAHEEGLAGYAMFEILGRYRPERARTAPADVHRAVVASVERHILSEEHEDPPDGTYTAEATP